MTYKDFKNHIIKAIKKLNETGDGITENYIIDNMRKIVILTVREYMENSDNDGRNQLFDAAREKDISIYEYVFNIIKDNKESIVKAINK